MKIDKIKLEKQIPSFLLPTMKKIYCYYQYICTIILSKKENITHKYKKYKKTILIYGVSGLGFGGTEKNLQIIAKHLNKDTYNIYYMYGVEPRKLGDYNLDTINERKKFIVSGGKITLIPFSYTNLSEKNPFIISDMSPKIQNIIKTYNIDLVITAGAGNCEFPLTEINKPIIFLNIFGIPNILRNIKYHLCISNEVGEKIKYIVPNEKIKTFYVPTEGPLNTSKNDGKKFRKKLGIKENDIIFGRIGRADNSIFDPIGILAFEQVVKRNNNIHYVIVSPPEILMKIVKNNKIPNVHFIKPLYSERDVWAFHNSIDVLAHFRLDGESCGLNIAESMICGNPIITHKSKIWNAHLEYLNNNNSFIANIDNIKEYSKAINIFAKDSNKKLIKKMGKESYLIAMEKFHIDNYIKNLNKIISEII